MYLFVDTETSGRSTATSRSVQIAWVLTDSAGRSVSEESHIIRPDDFLIEPGAIRVHGISQQRAVHEGKPLRDVLHKLQSALDVADVLIGHNISFDVAILQNDMRAVRHPMQLHDFPKICTMRASTAWCRISSLNGKKGFKWPTLSELHRRCFGTDFDGAHDALIDVQATSRCFFKLIELDVIERPLHRTKPIIKKPAAQAAPTAAPTAASTREPLSKATAQSAPRTISSENDTTRQRSSSKFSESANGSVKFPQSAIKQPPKKITSTLAASGVCSGCHSAFSVTLTRYEISSRCPKCFALVHFNIDWSQ